MTNQCSIEGCTREPEGRGWCHAHLLRYLRLGHTIAGRPIGRQTNETCTVEGCERPAVALEMCRTHRNRLRKYGDAQATKPIREVAGDGYVNKGYRIVPVPRDERHLANGEHAAAEHRLVMARHLGRPLTASESVHHVNGDRLDNRIENLELWSRWQPSGQRVEDKVAWALDILRRYAPHTLANPSDA